MCRDLNKIVQYSIPVCHIKEAHLKKQWRKRFHPADTRFSKQGQKNWLYMPHFLYFPNFSTEYVSLSCKTTGALATGNELSGRCTYEVY